MTLEGIDEYYRKGLKTIIRNDGPALELLGGKVRPDCHEPDEGGVPYAVCKGRLFDNAGGNWNGPFGEKHILYKGFDHKTIAEINLADLTALAIYGYQAFIKKYGIAEAYTDESIQKVVKA